MKRFFCSSLPNSRRAGPNIQRPNENKAGRALIRRSSCCRMRACALLRPPPPYSAGHSGAVQPFSPMRSSQTFESGFLNASRVPPQTISSSFIGVRMLGGQFSSSQFCTLVRNSSRSSGASKAIIILPFWCGCTCFCSQMQHLNGQASQ